MIGFGAEVDNQSSREMDGSRLKLNEHVCYMTPRKNKTETRVIAEIARGTINPGKEFFTSEEILPYENFYRNRIKS
jgi:hypothetical protein